MLPFFKKPPLIGLDISLDEIRLLQFTRKNQQFYLEKYGCVSLSSGAVMDGKMVNWRVIQAQLENIVLETRTRGCSAAIALPSHEIIKKKIQLPASLLEGEIMEEIKSHLSHYLPGIVEDEVHFDFTILSSTEDAHEVLLIATRKEFLQPYIDSCHQAGLKVVIVDVDLYALARGAGLCVLQCRKDSEDTFLLLDLRRPLCTFIVFHERDVIFHQQWRVDTNNVDISINFIDTIFQQFKNAWQVCVATYSDMKIKTIYISGSLKNVDVLMGYLDHQFNIPTQYINPFKLIHYSSSMKEKIPKWEATKFLLCCGLAMRTTFLC